MVSQRAAHVLGNRKVNQEQEQPLRRAPNAFVQRSLQVPLTAPLHRLRKQENNHAATSTQKIS
jgi:hypothetical protein